MQGKTYMYVISHNWFLFRVVWVHANGVTLHTERGKGKTEAMLLKTACNVS